MIGIVDYGMGNLTSVTNAFASLGADCRVVRSGPEVAGADAIVLPGVGAFGAGMENLRTKGLIGALEQAVLQRKRPFLGICLGMQLLSTTGHEFGRHAGLGWIPGETKRIQAPRLPHVGWSDIRILRANPLLGSEEDGADYYFVHSFHFEPERKADVSAECRYGQEFAAAVCRDNIYGVQFHPEKSHRAGLRILRRFAELSCSKNA